MCRENLDWTTCREEDRWLRLEGRHTYGGRVEYLFYSKETGEFVERSSGTTTSELSVGLTFNY